MSLITAMFLLTVDSSLELVVWLVPSFVGGAIAVSFIGMFLGPIYPIVMNHSARILPHWLLTGAIGWIAGLGQAGSAFIPFITGAIASKEGIKTLQPVSVFYSRILDRLLHAHSYSFPPEWWQ